MRLDEFVTETLKQIMGGVKAAQEHAVELGGTVSPLDVTDPLAKTRGGVRVPFVPGQGLLHSVAFDVALTVMEGEKGKGGFGLFVAGVLGLGAQAQTEASASSLSRIRFEVPVTYPPTRRSAYEPNKKES